MPTDRARRRSASASFPSRALTITSASRRVSCSCCPSTEVCSCPRRAPARSSVPTPPGDDRFAAQRHLDGADESARAERLERRTPRRRRAPPRAAPPGRARARRRAPRSRRSLGDPADGEDAASRRSRSRRGPARPRTARRPWPLATRRRRRPRRRDRRAPSTLRRAARTSAWPPATTTARRGPPHKLPGRESSPDMSAEESKSRRRPLPLPPIDSGRWTAVSEGWSSPLPARQSPGAGEPANGLALSLPAR